MRPKWKNVSTESQNREARIQHHKETKDIKRIILNLKIDNIFSISRKASGPDVKERKLFRLCETTYIVNPTTSIRNIYFSEEVDCQI